MNNYLIATIKSWNVEAYYKYAKTLPGNWSLVSSKDELTLDFLHSLSPRYIFFPHWSWIVPDAILEAYECVCFHMTDLPYGRGGSPLQNLIIRGHKQTKITALRMSNDLDAGPVYFKTDLSLEGRAQDIYERTAELSYQMIKEIVEEEPEPVPQEGKLTWFDRRTEEMSVLPQKGSLELLYNHIRMLDAESYPTAYYDHGAFRLTFSHAEFSEDGLLSAKVNIRLRDK